MGNTFLSATVNFDDFLKIASKDISGYILKNNEIALKKAYTFFQNDANNILILTGFSGTGKKQLAEHVLSYMDKETIVCKFVCTESSKLDDAELNFHNILRKKIAVKKNTESDALNSVKDKIDYILSDQKLKFVFVFYNMDFLQKENRDEILDYIYTYSSFQNVKALIVSRIFDTDIIPDGQKYVKIMTKALSKELFESYIRDFGIKASASLIEQLYRLTRGYFLYTCLSSKIMVNRELSINDYIIEYSNSGCKFDEFLAKKYYTLIVGTTRSVFNIFLKLRHGLNANVLKNLGGYPENVLKTLNVNFYIYKKGDLYYPAAFLKQHLAKIAKEEISKEKLISYYEKQVELSIEERDFIISDAALCEEIAFYKNTQPEISEDTAIDKSEPAEITSKTKTSLNEYVNLSTTELYEKSLEFFRSDDYLKTLDILSILLSQKTAQEDRTLINSAYTLLAKTYVKLGKWKYAQHYYEILKEYYTLNNDKENLYNIRYELANIYYHSYRIIDAIKELKTLLTLTKDKRITAGCDIILGNIALSAANEELARQYYKDGINNIDENTGKALSIELYFKYAVLSDESNDIDSAVEYYQKVITLNEDGNKYTALAYSNLGDLFYDNELFEDAKECFKKAYLADKNNGGEYGMYYCLSKIVELTDKKESKIRIQNACEAKEHALKTGDYHSIVEATIKLGDLYYDYSNPQKALEEYIALYRADKDIFDEYNLKMLKSRLDDIKAQLGEDEFKKLVSDYE